MVILPNKVKHVHCYFLFSWLRYNFKTAYLEGDNYIFIKTLMHDDFIISCKAHNVIDQSKLLLQKFNMIFAFWIPTNINNGAHELWKVITLMYDDFIISWKTHNVINQAKLLLRKFNIISQWLHWSFIYPPVISPDL